MSCRLLNKVYAKTDNTYSEDSIIKIEIKDNGVGIEDIDRAREPLFTTKPELERSGMGFMFMEMFMDKVEVKSQPGEGTSVMMEKKIKKLKKQV